MWKTNHILCFLLFGLTLLSSCSVEKRRYLKGFYVHHQSKHTKKSYQDPNENVLTQVKNKIETSERKKKEQNENLVVSSKKQIAPIYKPLIFKAPGDTCDTLVLRSDVQILARVLEITTDLVRYKHCDNPDGPTFNVPLNNVSMIKYKNGTKDEFKIEPKREIGTGIGGTTGSSYSGGSYSNSSNITDPEKVIKKGNATLIWGILSFPLLIIYGFGIVCAIVAIENAVSLKRWIKREPYLYNESAVRKANAGMIIGIVLLSLLFLIIVVAIAVAAGGSFLWF